jgi:hypothetical protein
MNSIAIFIYKIIILSVVIFVPFLSRLGDVLVTVVMGVSCSFVFKVLFMIAYQVVLVRCWL